MALAACKSDVPGEHNIRVFYGSKHGEIAEACGKFDNDDWTRGAWFWDTDPIAGVACSTYGGLLNVYLRETKTKKVQHQWTFFYQDHGAHCKANSNSL